jgi:hypothetical protein
VPMAGALKQRQSAGAEHETRRAKHKKSGTSS